MKKNKIRSLSTFVLEAIQQFYTIYTYTNVENDENSVALLEELVTKYDALVRSYTTVYYKDKDIYECRYDKELSQLRITLLNPYTSDVAKKKFSAFTKSMLLDSIKSANIDPDLHVENNIDMVGEIVPIDEVVVQDKVASDITYSEYLVKTFVQHYGGLEGDTLVERSQRLLEKIDSAIKQLVSTNDAYTESFDRLINLYNNIFTNNLVSAGKPISTLMLEYINNPDTRPVVDYLKDKIEAPNDYPSETKTEEVVAKDIVKAKDLFTGTLDNKISNYLVLNAKKPEEINIIIDRLNAYLLEVVNTLLITGEDGGVTMRNEESSLVFEYLSNITNVLDTIYSGIEDVYDVAQLNKLSITKAYKLYSLQRDVGYKARKIFDIADTPKV